MVDINIKAKLQITAREQNRIKNKIKKIINNKIGKFVTIFATKVRNIAADLTVEVKSQSVVGFIKGKGKGELGITDPDNIINRMLLALIQSSTATTGTKKVDMKIGKTASMRLASKFIWTTQKFTPGYIVNLYSLIQNEPIPAAGWDGSGVPNAGFINITGRRLEAGKAGGIDLSQFSRTGEGLMVGLNRSGVRPYRLPLRHIKGFSRFLQGQGADIFAKIINKYLIESLREVGINTSGGTRLVRFGV